MCIWYTPVYCQALSSVRVYVLLIFVSLWPECLRKNLRGAHFCLDPQFLRSQSSCLAPQAWKNNTVERACQQLTSQLPRNREWDRKGQGQDTIRTPPIVVDCSSEAPLPKVFQLHQNSLVTKHSKHKAMGDIQLKPLQPRSNEHGSKSLDSKHYSQDRVVKDTLNASTWEAKADRSLRVQS